MQSPDDSRSPRLCTLNCQIVYFEMLFCLAWYSMICFRVSYGAFAGTWRPLIASVGTDETSRSFASCTEASTAAFVSGVFAHAETFAGSSPALVTALFNVNVAPSAVAKPSCPSNTAAANVKNAELPPSLATHTPYSAAIFDSG